MKCPHCNIPLMMSDRKGIEIDFCTNCRGVWLDKGELDKIITLSSNELNTIRNSGAYDNAKPNPVNSSYQRVEQYKRQDTGSQYQKHRKNKSIFSELFDVFD